MKVYLHHDRIHHEEKTQGNRDGDDWRAVHENGHTVERTGDFRRNLSERYPEDNAQGYPYRQVAFEETYPLAIDAGRFIVSDYYRAPTVSCENVQRLKTVAVDLYQSSGVLGFWFEIGGGKYR